MSVRWGKYASTVSSLAGAVKNGFDWVQLPLGLIMEMTNEQFVRFKTKALKNNTCFDICALNLPDDVIITQKGFNIYVWMEYLKKAVIRMAELNCRALVWSNGRARILPEEGDIMGAKEQVAQFLFMLCELSSQYKMEILVEPLSTDHTNFLNTIEETAAFMQLITVDNLGISISENEMPPKSLNSELLIRYKELIQLVRLNTSLSVLGDVPAVYEALRLSGYSAAVILPETSGSTELSLCKKLFDPDAAAPF